MRRCCATRTQRRAALAVFHRLERGLDARWLDRLRGAERRLDATANASLLPSVVNQNAEDEQDAGDDQTELEVAYRHCGGPADDARRRPDLANIISKIIPPRSIDNAPGRCAYSAAAAGCAISSASAMSTATTREMPGSGIVMPTNCCAISIVILLCEMNRNCVCSAISRTILQKRSVFGSSSGASTSSNRQNGAGLTWPSSAIALVNRSISAGSVRALPQAFSASAIASTWACASAS